MKNFSKQQIFRTPTLLYLIAGLIIVASLAGVIFEIVSRVEYSDEILINQDFYTANHILQIIAQGISFLGIVAGIAGFLYMRSNNNYIYEMRLSRSLYYAGGLVILLTIVATTCWVIYTRDFNTVVWDQAQWFAWELTEGFFYAGVLFGFAFLVRQRGILTIPLPEKQSIDTDDESMYPCPQCRNEVAPDWRLCPYCGENLFETVGYCCSKCGNDVEDDWLVCPVCKEPLDQEETTNDDSV